MAVVVFQNYNQNAHWNCNFFHVFFSKFIPEIWIQVTWTQWRKILSHGAFLFQCTDDTFIWQILGLIFAIRNDEKSNIKHCILRTQFLDTRNCLNIIFWYCEWLVLSIMNYYCIFSNKVFGVFYFPWFSNLDLILEKTTTN